MSFKIRWCMILVENLAQLGLKGNEMVDKPDWDLRLGYLIHDVSRLRRMMFDRDLAPLGITRSQWWVLAFISRKDGLPQTQLANELDVGKVAVGALIDRLESSGHRSEATGKRFRCASGHEAQPARHVGRHAVRESKRGRRRGGATHQDPEATTGSLRASSPAPSSAVPFCAVHILK